MPGFRLARLTLFTAAAAMLSPAVAEERSGQALYLEHCSNCHGVYGEGDGAVTPDLPLVLLDLRYLSARNDAVFPRAFVTQVIDGRQSPEQHGLTGMPVWGAQFTRDLGATPAAQEAVARRVEVLVDFLEAMQLSE